MIWFFDSGVGGLRTMEAVREMYPFYDYLFLWDTIHSPYGEKNADEIKKYTYSWLQWLFDHWCSLVVIACNTAAAYAIRDRQRDFPHKKVLSVTVPGVEKMLSLSQNSLCFHILCTKAMSQSGIYEDLYARMWWDASLLSCIPAQKLVSFAEKWIIDGTDVDDYLSSLFQSLSIRNWSDDVLVLWCTHFPLFRRAFEKLWGWDIVDPGYEAAKSLWPYIARHSELGLCSSWSSDYEETWTVRYVVSWNASVFTDTAFSLLWRRLDVESLNSIFDR